MKVRINGQDEELDGGATVAEVVASFAAFPGAPVAVAHNGEVVVRSRWQTTSLDDGDRIEILGAMQGG